MAIIKIHNIETNEIIERDMTTEELAQVEIDRQTAENEFNIKLEKSIARQELLDRLGITADEAKLLLS